MRKSFLHLFALALCCGAVIVGPVRAQELDDPGAGDGGQCQDEEISVTGAAVAVLDNLVDAQCECDPAKLAEYKRCAKKYYNKTFANSKALAKLNGERASDLRDSLSDEVEALVTFCEESGDDSEEPGQGDDAGGDQPA